MLECKENYLALFLSIVTPLSADSSLKEMGLYVETKPNGAKRKRNAAMSKSFLLQKLKEKSEQIGRTPTMEEMDMDASMPGGSVYMKKFQNYKEACVLAGLKPNRSGGKR